MADYVGCLQYAVERYKDDHDGDNPVTVKGQKNATKYWENIPEENRFMHVREHSIAMWTGGPKGEGHAAYIEKLGSNGTITLSHVNWRGNMDPTEMTFDDAYDMNQTIGVNGLEFVGYVAPAED